MELMFDQDQSDLILSNQFRLVLQQFLKPNENFRHHWSTINETKQIDLEINDRLTHKIRDHRTKQPVKNL